MLFYFLRFITVFILSFLLFSCQFVRYVFGGKKEIQAQEHLSLYLKNIPQEESVNASLYNYELIVKSMRSHLAKENNEEVVSQFSKYLQTFFESEPYDQSEVYFLVAQAIKNILRDPNSEEKLFFIRNKYFRQYLRTPLYLPYGSEYLGSPSKRSGLVILKNQNVFEQKNTLKKHFKKKLRETDFFWQVVLMRENYVSERDAFSKIFLSNFLPLKNKKDFQHNIKYFYWSITRYPGLMEYEKMMNNSHFLPQTLHEKKKYHFSKYEKKIEIIQKILKSRVPQKVFNQKIWAFAYPNGAVLRNRSHKISSRNIFYLKDWEPFLILSEHNGEDGEKWFCVKWHGSQWFLSADVLLLMSNSEYTQKLKLSHQNIVLMGKEKDKEMENYLKCYEFFGEKYYVSSIDCILRNLKDSSKFMQQFFWILFYKNLGEIAIRSTSQKNKYTDFVKKYPLYFVSDEENYNLYPDGFILQELIKIAPNSVMLQYFDSLGQKNLPKKQDKIIR